MKGIALHNAEEGQFVEIFVPEELLEEEEQQPDLLSDREGFLPWILVVEIMLVSGSVGFILGRIL